MLTILILPYCHLFQRIFDLPSSCRSCCSCCCLHFHIAAPFCQLRPNATPPLNPRSPRLQLRTPMLAECPRHAFTCVSLWHIWTIVRVVLYISGNVFGVLVSMVRMFAWFGHTRLDHPLEVFLHYKQMIRKFHKGSLQVTSFRPPMFMSMSYARL